jgi:hypothetical protein
MKTARSLPRPFPRRCGLLLVLLAWGCHSNGATRDAALDVARPDLMPANDRPADIAFPVDGKTFDGQQALDGRPDVPIGSDASADLSPDQPVADSKADVLQADAGLFLCHSRVGSPSLFCDQSQYCLEQQPGAVGYTESGYSCGSLPAACVGKATCDCLCGPGAAYDCRTSMGHCRCTERGDGLVVVCPGA